jgi:hypothetical protein
VKATILAFLAQQNAEELEKLAGGPVNFWEYAIPVYTAANGENGVVPSGGRIAPGMNAITQSIGQGKVEGLASALNPGIGIALAGISGVDSFTGEKVANSPAEHGLLALNSLLSTFPPFRASGLNELGHGRQSFSSKFYEEHDPNHDPRSYVFPFLPQSGASYGEARAFSRAQSEKYADPIPRLDPSLYEIATNHDWKAAEAIRKQHNRSEAAAAKVKEAEAAYFEDQGFDSEASEILAYMTGHYYVPAEVTPPRPRKARRARRARTTGIGGGPGSIGAIGGGSAGSIGGVGAGGGIGGPGNRIGGL